MVGGEIVRKGNPTEQGLKLLDGHIVIGNYEGPKRKSNRTRIETWCVRLRPREQRIQVRKGNPTEQGLKQFPHPLFHLFQSPKRKSNRTRIETGSI